MDLICFDHIITYTEESTWLFANLESILLNFLYMLTQNFSAFVVKPGHFIANKLFSYLKTLKLNCENQKTSKNKMAFFRFVGPQIVVTHLGCRRILTRAELMFSADPHPWASAVVTGSGRTERTSQWVIIPVQLGPRKKPCQSYSVFRIIKR